VLVGAVLSALSPGPISVGLGPIRNPLGGESVPSFIELVDRIVNSLLFGAVISLFIRLRRARELERQQIKWFVYATALTICGGILTYLVSEAIGSVWLKWIGFVPFIVGVMAIPISMGIAILRYRLYDIDILINRTLVYGALTAMLVAVYFGGVTATQTIFHALTAQEEQPQLAIVISTLGIAALFNPLRGRVQGFVDRRFYRNNYDARKILEAYSTKLRDQTHLDALSDDLVGVVKETMQPAHVSLWLRPDTASKGQQSD
jgi:hypothetical protein